MSDTFHVIARIRANPDRLEDLLGAFALLIEDVETETGCLGYRLMQDTDEAATLVVIEEWASREHWEAHLDGGAMAAHRDRVGPDWIAEIEVHPLRPVRPAAPRS